MKASAKASVKVSVKVSVKASEKIRKGFAKSSGKQRVRRERTGLLSVLIIITCTKCKLRQYTIIMKFVIMSSAAVHLFAF